MKSMTYQSTIEVRFTNNNGWQSERLSIFTCTQNKNHKAPHQLQKSNFFFVEIDVNRSSYQHKKKEKKILFFVIAVFCKILHDAFLILCPPNVCQAFEKVSRALLKRVWSKKKSQVPLHSESLLPQQIHPTFGGIKMTCD